MRYVPGVLLLLLGLAVTGHALATPGEQLGQAFVGGLVQGLGIALIAGAWLNRGVDWR